MLVLTSMLISQRNTIHGIYDIKAEKVAKLAQSTMEDNTTCIQSFGTGTETDQQY